MVKKFSAMALAALIAWPAMAGATATPAELEAQIERLTKELSAMKADMANMKKDGGSSDVEDLKEKSEKWDEAARIQLSGDFRTRLDYVSADTPDHWQAMDVGEGISDWQTVGKIMNKYNSVNAGTHIGDVAMAYQMSSPSNLAAGQLASAAGLGDFAPLGAGQQALAGGANAAGVSGAIAAGAGAITVANGFTAAEVNNANLVATAAATAAAAPGATGQSVFNAAAGEAQGAGQVKAASVPLSAAEMASMQKVFNSPPVQSLLAGMMTYPIAAATPTFTDTEKLATFMKGLSAAQRQAIFQGMGYNTTKSSDYDNDTMWTNRLRVNLRAKATEDLEFKARLAMYKSWGMANNPVDYTANAGMGGGAFMLNSLSFDGNSTRQPEDNALRVDRAFMNWNNLGGSSAWFSIGRRPTTDGPPSQFRMGADDRLATPVSYMDYPFDGLSLGYGYKSLFGMQDFPGKIRFCYGRGFESGPTDNGSGVNDTDFGGLSWDVYDKDGRFFSIQSFAAFNMFNVPDNINFVNPVEYFAWQHDTSQLDPTDPNRNLTLDRKNLGNIYHTDAVYYNTINSFNYFLAAGWSRTKANGFDEMGTSLLGSWWDNPSDKNGYSVYTGMRYDIPNQPLKVGLEYNYGTKNWISFTPGNDDLYASKLATRGHVIEAYGLWNIPAGEAISRFGKAFMRLGYQHYMYNYTGSGFWLGEPQDIDELKNDPMAAQFYTPVDTMDQVYLSLEAWF